MITEPELPPHLSLLEIAATHGPSYYVADTERLNGNITTLTEAFRQIYVKTAIGYSFKTNYLPAFIREADRIGAYSEVVSGFELAIAIRLGVSPENIIFNGPVKSRRDLEIAVETGVVINVDSLDELRVLVEVARANGTRPVRTGIRCNLGAPLSTGSRFGLSPSSDDFADAVATIDACPQLVLAGLHFHHSADRTAEGFRARAQALAEVHRSQLEGRPLDYLDIGGGLASAMPAQLADQVPFQPASYSDYAETVAPVLVERYGQEGPTLVLEPGMGILADTMSFITQVVATKEIDGQPIAIVDGSLFDVMPLRGRVELPVHSVPGPSPHVGTLRDWTIVGNTCMEIDVLRRRFRADLVSGDFLLFDHVGAYSFVLDPTFIRPTAPILKVNGGDVSNVLRRASTVDDLLRQFLIEP